VRGRPLLEAKYEKVFPNLEGRWKRVGEFKDNAPFDCPYKEERAFSRVSLFEPIVSKGADNRLLALQLKNPEQAAKYMAASAIASYPV
jgi:hypothetical protein